MIGFLRKYGKDRHYYELIHRIFGVWASNIELYKLALVHRSASIYVDADTAVNNERLEFLGDAVLETVISEFLFIEYPDMQEGELTKLRSKIVCRATLNELGRKIGLKGEIVANHTSGINFSKQNMYGDAFEALCGALYLDKGYDKANRTLLYLFDSHLNVSELMETEIDFKSRMIEWSQKERRTMQFWTEKSVNYTELNPMYETVLMISGERWGYGCSRSKKESEQKAARAAYEKVKSDSAVEEPV